MGPVHYKTSTINSGQTAPKAGKADSASPSTASGASSVPNTDSYMEKLEAEGYKKQGKAPPPKGDVKSGDPMTDLLDALDKVNNEGVPQGNMVPFVKLSAEGALSKFPDAPQDVLSKFNSIVAIIQKKVSDLGKGLASGTGTPQQVQAAQQLRAQLEDLLSFYKIQRDKVAAIIPQKEKFWTNELKNFQEKGGSADPRDFDLDSDGWIGQPETDGSYRIGMRTHDKPFEDPENKKLSEAGSAIQYKFKKGDIQYSAINPKTSMRVHFDPKTKRIIGEQIAAPGYVAEMGVGFGGEDDTNVMPNDKGTIELKAGKLSNSQNFAEAGLQLFTTEFLWVRVDSDGEIEKSDQGYMQPAPFGLKDGHLVQKTPTGDDKSHYKQVYVKEMKVRTDNSTGNAGGDIVVELRGGDDNAKIMGMRITAPDSKTQASDVALAITSGTGDSHRETPIILDAGGYESTSRVGIQDPKHFASQFNYDGARHATGPQADQINDTLKHFVAQGDSGKIDSLLNRGIAFQTRGYITGTNGNDLFVVEPPPDSLSVKDAAYATVIDGQGGHNAVFGQEVGSVFATGITMASIENTKAEAEISIGINPFGEKKSDSGNIGPITGESGKSNKLYIQVKAPQSKVAIQSTPDGLLNASMEKGTGDPTKDAWDQTHDDYYDISAEEVRTNSLDANNPNWSFDPDLNVQFAGTKDERRPIKGKMGPAATEDFLAGGEIYKEKTDKLSDSIKKKATEKEEEWKVDGTTRSWMKGKYYQGDKNTLEQFFSDFSASKVNKLDPFQQVDAGMKQAEGED